MRVRRRAFSSAARLPDLRRRCTFPFWRSLVARGHQHGRTCFGPSWHSRRGVFSASAGRFAPGWHSADFSSSRGCKARRDGFIVNQSEPFPFELRDTDVGSQWRPKSGPLRNRVCRGSSFEAAACAYSVGFSILEICPASAGSQVRGLVHPFTVVENLLQTPAQSSQDLIMRLALGQRRGNARWRKLPWAQMANPSMFVFLGLSPETLQGKVPQAMVGDLPDWYHTLRLPEPMAQHFALDGVLPRDLANDAPQYDGHHSHAAGRDVVGAGFITLLTGWIRAVVLAHWTLEDALESMLSQFKSSPSLLLLRRPTATWTRSWFSTRGVHRRRWGEHRWRGGGYRVASGQAAGGGRQGVKGRGLGVRKGTYTFEGVSLGREICPLDFGVRFRGATVGRRSALPRSS